MKEKDVRFLMQMVYALVLLFIYLLSSVFLEVLPEEVLNIQISSASALEVITLFITSFVVWMKFSDFFANKYGK